LRADSTSRVGDQSRDEKRGTVYKVHKLASSITQSKNRRIIISCFSKNNDSKSLAEKEQGDNNSTSKPAIGIHRFTRLLTGKAASGETRPPPSCGDGDPGTWDMAEEGKEHLWCGEERSELILDHELSN
jgi:hypothetical protein